MRINAIPAHAIREAVFFCHFAASRFPACLPGWLATPNLYDSPTPLASSLSPGPRERLRPLTSCQCSEKTGRQQPDRGCGGCASNAPCRFAAAPTTGRRPTVQHCCLPARQSAAEYLDLAAARKLHCDFNQETGQEAQPPIGARLVAVR